jgi:hypothetical protein
MLWGHYIEKASKLANLYHFSCKILQSLLTLRLIIDAYKKNKRKNVYWKHTQGNTQIRLRDKTSHINLAFVSKTTPHTPLSWLFFIFIFHELHTQPLVQHGSPTFNLSLKFLKSLWVVDKWLNWYWIVIGALLEFSLYSILDLLFFSSVSSFLCEFQSLLLVPLKCSWYHMFRWYI